MQYKAYVMNLDRAPHRWEHIKRQLDPSGMEYERFPAIDGVSIDITYVDSGQTFTGRHLQDRKIKISLNKQISVNCKDEDQTSFSILSKKFAFVPGEIGRYCSDILIWKDALKNNYENIVVFEDDFNVKRKPLFKKELEDFINELPKTYDVAYFSVWWGNGSNQVENVPGTNCVKSLTKNFGAWGAPAMIISNKGVEKLLNAKSYDVPIDLFYLDHNYNKIAMHGGEYLEVYASCYGNELMIGALNSELPRY